VYIIPGFRSGPSDGPISSWGDVRCSSGMTGNRVGSSVWGVDRPGERGSEGVELGLEAGVVTARAAALHEVPDRVLPGLPGLLNFWGLGGLDGSGGEVVRARGDLDPGVDGGDLAFPVTQLGLLRAGDGRKPGDEVAPGGFVDGPGFQGLAPLLVVDQRGCGLVEFGGKGFECSGRGRADRIQGSVLRGAAGAGCRRRRPPSIAGGWSHRSGVGRCVTRRGADACVIPRRRSVPMRTAGSFQGLLRSAPRSRPSCVL
jgi:hypothetical protein